MTTRWPDTFVVGAPRCGTSAMHHYLSQHPQVYMSPRKEPLFFATDLAGLPGPRITTREEYLALFSGVADEGRIGESSPYYLYSAAAGDAIGRHCPDARVIIMLRNPADMMYSMYWAWSYAGFEDLRTFEEALHRERDQDGQPGRFILRYQHLSRYVEPVERYVSRFGRSRVHVVIFDDLARDPPAVYRELCRFLDVSLDFQPRFALSAFERAASRRPLSLRLSRFLSSARPALGGTIGQRAVATIRDAVRRWGTVPPPPMRPELRRQILRECAPDIRRVSQIIGRDLSGWEQ